MRLNSRSNCSLPPRTTGRLVFDELGLVQHAPKGVSAYTMDPVASNRGSHLRCESTAGVILSDESQVIAVDLVRRDISPALTRHYLADMIPQSDLPSEA